ncbi:MAG: tRNA-dihydrouridine synthase, partial [Woeseiaceae bacterium]|nr:tRNA-dihydrouridine synthase [Woeseiaceae bacterium]
EHVDGVMIGREAYHNPYFLAELEARFGTGQAPPERHDIVRQMLPYVEAELARGIRLTSITRHMLGLFAGQPGARAWRRYLSENAHRETASAGVLTEALESLERVAAA